MTVGVYQMGTGKRTMRFVSLAAAGTTFFLVTSCNLRAEPSTGKIVGLGAVSCIQFATDVSKDPTIQREYLAWAQGFMSGILLGRPAGIDEGLDLLPSTFPVTKQLGFLREYCAEHPSEGFADAVESLYKRLRTGQEPCRHR